MMVSKCVPMSEVTQIKQVPFFLVLPVLVYTLIKLVTESMAMKNQWPGFQTFKEGISGTYHQTKNPYPRQREL